MSVLAALDAARAEAEQKLEEEQAREREKAEYDDGYGMPDHDNRSGCLEHWGGYVEYLGELRRALIALNRWQMGRNWGWTFFGGNTFEHHHRQVGPQWWHVENFKAADVAFGFVPGNENYSCGSAEERATRVAEIAREIYDQVAAWSEIDPARRVGMRRAADVLAAAKPDAIRIVLASEQAAA